MDNINSDLLGYDSPIFMAVKRHCDEIIEKRENEFVARIEEEVGFHIDKEELVKALNYERDEYSKGYRYGYNEGYQKGRDDVIEELKEHFGSILSSEPKTESLTKWEARTNE